MNGIKVALCKTQPAGWRRVWPISRRHQFYTQTRYVWACVVV